MSLDTNTNLDLKYNTFIADEDGELLGGSASLCFNGWEVGVVLMSKKVIVLILMIILSISTIVACTPDKKEESIGANHKTEEYIYDGETEVEIDGRSFHLEDTEALNISIVNQEKLF